MAGVRDPKALAAHIGRQKFGASKMARIAKEGLRRFHAARKAGKKPPRKTFREGGGGTFAAVVKALRGDKHGAVRNILNARTAALKRKAAKAAGVAD